jgi:WXG100 family type VII secretion target
MAIRGPVDSASGGRLTGSTVRSQAQSGSSRRTTWQGSASRRSSSSLAGSLAPLGGEWAGVAQQRFEALWAEWQRSARSLHEALTGISTLLNQAGVHYAEAEHAIAGSFGAM